MGGWVGGGLGGWGGGEVGGDTWGIRRMFCSLRFKAGCYDCFSGMVTLVFGV